MAFLPRTREAGPPQPAFRSTNVFGGDTGSTAPNEAYFPGYYPGYTTYQPRNNDRTQFDPLVSVNVGLDQGASTVGFRVNKYNPEEWHQNNYQKYYQAFADRNVFEQNRWRSDQVSKETEATTNRTQALTTKKTEFL